MSSTSGDNNSFIAKFNDRANSMMDGSSTHPKSYSIDIPSPESSGDSRRPSWGSRSRRLSASGSRVVEEATKGAAIAKRMSYDAAMGLAGEATAEGKAKAGAVESFDYFAHGAESGVQISKAWLTLIMVITTIGMGFVIGLAGIFVQYVGNDLITKVKFDDVFNVLETDGEWSSFVRLLLWMEGLMITATLLVATKPAAAGSGIPEVKSYLNGNNVPQMLEMRTCYTKVVSLICASSSGVAIGKEGPMVQTGAIIGASFGLGGKGAKLWSRILPGNLGDAIRRVLLQVLGNDKGHREYMLCGVAAGVAAAFSAPVGGVLFAFEEVSTFWTGNMTWRTFLSSMFGCLTMTFFYTSSMSGVFSREARGHGVQIVEYNAAEFVAFAFIGILGGLTGAAFIHLNMKLSHWRNHVAELAAKKKKKAFGRVTFWVCDTLVVTLITASLWFWTPKVMGCTPCPGVVEGNTTTSYSCQDESLHIRYFSCPEGEWNEMATLTLNGQETTAHSLLVAPSDMFSVETLVVMMTIYWSAMLLTNGLMISSSTFIPFITVGACAGRLIATSIDHFHPDEPCDHAIYALAGAAAMLGGFSRMTMSLTMMLVEMTMNIDMLLPIMVCVLVSKGVGDQFGPSLFDATMEMKNFPFLERDIPSTFKMLQAKDIMSPTLATVSTKESTVQLDTLLRTTPHNAFPVLAHNDPDAANNFVGLASRKGIESLLVPFRIGNFRQQQLVKRVIPLKGVVDNFPFTVPRDMPLVRVYGMFRELGLRHLCVMDRKNCIVGVITRKDLYRRIGKDDSSGYLESFTNRERSSKRKSSVSQSTRFLISSPTSTSSKVHIVDSSGTPAKKEADSDALEQTPPASWTPPSRPRPPTASAGKTATAESSEKSLKETARSGGGEEEEEEEDEGTTTPSCTSDSSEASVPGNDVDV